MKVTGTTAGADYRLEVDGLRAVAVRAVVVGGTLAAGWVWLLPVDY